MHGSWDNSHVKEKTSDVHYGLMQVGGGTGKYASKNQQPSESTIVANAIKAARKAFPQAFIMKMHGGGYQSEGLPDVYVLIEGKTLWVEFKKPGGDTTATQRAKLMELKEAGAYVGTAESVERFIAMILDVQIDI